MKASKTTLYKITITIRVKGYFYRYTNKPYQFKTLKSGYLEVLGKSKINCGKEGSRFYSMVAGYQFVERIGTNILAKLYVGS